MERFLALSFRAGMACVILLCLTWVWYGVGSPPNFLLICGILLGLFMGVWLLAIALWLRSSRPKEENKPSAPASSTTTTRRMPAAKTEEYQRKWAFTDADEYWR